MPLRSDHTRWSTAAKTFHWLMALLILGNGAFAFWMDGLKPSLAKINMFALHKSIGLTVLALFLLRVLWRAIDRRPPDVPAPRWQHLAAKSVHGFLYLLIAAIPLSGWAFNSAHGFPLQYFKQFNLPALVEKNPGLSDTLSMVHVYLFWFLLLVLVAHVGGALKHHFIDRDDTLRRMLPFGRAKRMPPTSSGDTP
ncbi:cytochrome B [Luteibacter rhizovicinus DSM 16549]|uniref:Cytochrome B n=1 Tax=Luteibacter rhizovicinus DSM 16549 TaxID=1440763 RepID=A0A0G9HH94_9GAMM|nr:cytochrome b [Luteibacter rhizovicinus]APG02894.1 cytochrome B [Luteibacter rhizovicinus DSM 16549]KLD68564.1 cytochrome B561 [Luteibacter rhizovicinus DSM 16549]KLD79718.1 cytochrome B561 [Xanthomonas hyacinthi DSM 19077]